MTPAPLLLFLRIIALSCLPVGVIVSTEPSVLHPLLAVFCIILAGLDLFVLDQILPKYSFREIRHKYSFREIRHKELKLLLYTSMLYSSILYPFLSEILNFPYNSLIFLVVLSSVAGTISVLP